MSKLPGQAQPGLRQLGQHVPGELGSCSRFPGGQFRRCPNSQAAAQAAAKGSAPWQSRPRSKPVRMSPEPPVGPSVPVMLTAALPSGSAMHVLAPLRITVHCHCRAARRHASSGAATTSATGAAKRRAISPGWGVTTVGAGRRGMPGARTFKASASRTSGKGDWSSKSASARFPHTPAARADGCHGIFRLHQFHGFGAQRALFGIGQGQGQGLPQAALDDGVDLLRAGNGEQARPPRKAAVPAIIAPLIPAPATSNPWP